MRVYWILCNRCIPHPRSACMKTSSLLRGFFFVLSLLFGPKVQYIIHVYVCLTLFGRTLFFHLWSQQVFLHKLSCMQRYSHQFLVKVSTVSVLYINCARYAETEVLWWHIALEIGLLNIWSCAPLRCSFDFYITERFIFIFTVESHCKELSIYNFFQVSHEEFMLLGNVTHSDFTI